MELERTRTHTDDGEGKKCTFPPLLAPKKEGEGNAHTLLLLLLSPLLLPTDLQKVSASPTLLPPPFMFRMENRRGRNGNQRFFHVSGSEAEGGEKGGRKRKEFFPEKEGETTEKKPVHLFFLLEE